MVEGSQSRQNRGDSGYMRGLPRIWGSLVGAGGGAVGFPTKRDPFYIMDISYERCQRPGSQPIIQLIAWSSCFTHSRFPSTYIVTL